LTIFNLIYCWSYISCCVCSPLLRGMERGCSSSWGLFTAVCW